MKQFFLNLINATAPESSKRFISLVCLGVFIIVVAGNVFFKYTVPDVVYYSLVSLILGSSAMTLMQNKT